MHHPAKALLAIFIAANVAAQERDASPTGLSAKLLSTKQWSMQCDPIRFTLRLRSDRNDVRVRITPHKAHAWLHPFEVEHQFEGQWVSTDERAASQQLPPAKRFTPAQKRHWLRNPATMLTGHSGTTIRKNSTSDLEAGFWQLQGLDRPGKIRVRLHLQTRSTEPVSIWQDFVMSWTTIEIYAHGGNAEGLLGKDAGDLGRRFEMICVALNKTMRQFQNEGPVNMGPSGPSDTKSNPWEIHQQTCQDLLANPVLSPRVRARALLARAYYCLEEARCMRDQDQQLLDRARKDLMSPELSMAKSGHGIAALPSGGLQPLVLMLKVCGDAGFGDDSLAVRKQTHAAICKANPFFAYWWRHEARYLLLQ